MSFTRIDHVTILAPDLDKARDIYFFSEPIFNNATLDS